MIDRIDFKEEWRKIADTDDTKVMWVNIHLNVISGYIEDLSTEFRLTKRLRKDISSTLGWEIFRLHYKGQEITFKIIAELLNEIIKTECEDAKISKRRIEKILNTVNQSMGDEDELNDMNLLIKAIILNKELQLDLFEDGYTIAEIDDITPDISYIMDQLRD